MNKKYIIINNKELFNEVKGIILKDNPNIEKLTDGGVVEIALQKFKDGVKNGKPKNKPKGK